jgi:hypothetical protein
MMKFLSFNRHKTIAVKIKPKKEQNGLPLLNLQVMTAFLLRNQLFGLFIQGHMIIYVQTPTHPGL